MVDLQHNSICKLCLLYRPLIKAHVLPESLYPHRTAGVSNVRLYSRNPDAFPKRSSIGVYDKTILCADCERQFQECDDHAQKVLRGAPCDRLASHFELHSFDYFLLKRFFLGLLWRASVSSHEMFSQVDVGPTHESRLRQMILSNDSGGPEEYAVWLFVFDDPETKGIVFQPTRVKVKGVNAYRFVCAGLVIFIKVDQRPTPYPLNQASLRPGAEIPVIVRRWATSSERSEMVRVAATAKGP